MQKYPDVYIEDGTTQLQWEGKKIRIFQSTEWGGDLKVCLLAIGIGRDIVVVTGSGDTFTSAQKFPCHPPPVPKMRGGMYIPTELSAQWKNYKQSPLLITHNGINHYDSTFFIS